MVLKWVAFVLATLVVNAHSDLAERKVLAAELLEAMGGEKQAEEARDQREKMADKMALMWNPDSEGALEDAESELGMGLDQIREASSWENRRHDFITVYSDLYTEEELRGLIAFYTSPLGKKYIANGPEVSRRMTERKMERLKPVVEAYKKTFDEKYDEPDAGIVAYNMSPSPYEFDVPNAVEFKSHDGVGLYNFEWKNEGRGYSTFYLMADILIKSEAEFDASGDEKVAEFCSMLEQQESELKEIERSECRYGEFKGTEIIFSVKTGEYLRTAYILYLWDGETAWQGMGTIENPEGYQKVQKWLRSARKLNAE